MRGGSDAFIRTAPMFHGNQTNRVTLTLFHSSYVGTGRKERVLCLLV